MFKKLSSFSVLLFLAFSGCQKDMKSNDAVTNNESKTQNPGLEDLSAGKVVSSAHWYGSYTNVMEWVATNLNDFPDAANSDPDGDPDPGDTLFNPEPVYVTDNNFIKNGVAELPALPNQFAYSNISFDIPSNYNIAGDSLIYEVVAKNSISGSFYDYDVVLQLIGDQHSAELHFVADVAAQQYTQYYAGSARFANLPQLVNYFGDFKIIKLVLKKNQTAAYINNLLVTNFNYGSNNLIGRLKTINIAGKGYIIVDNVKLSNSFTNKKILVENFNANGKSHTVFY